MKRNLYVGATFLALLVVLAVASHVLDEESRGPGRTVPRRQV